MLVRMTVTAQGSARSFTAGEIVEVDEQTAEAWITAGHASAHAAAPAAEIEIANPDAKKMTSKPREMV